MSSVQESPQSSAAGQAACEAFRIFERPRAGAYTRGASRAIFLSCYDVLVHHNKGSLAMGGFARFTMTIGTTAGDVFCLLGTLLWLAK